MSPWAYVVGAMLIELTGVDRHALNYEWHHSMDQGSWTAEQKGGSEPTVGGHRSQLLEHSCNVIRGHTLEATPSPALEDWPQTLIQKKPFPP